MSQSPGKLHCVQMAMDFLLARERKGLEDMAAAMKVTAAVCSDWNRDLFSCAFKHWYCRHVHLWDCLQCMNPVARRKMTWFALAEVRSRAISAFKLHTRCLWLTGMDTRNRGNFYCSLNCCRSPVGLNIALSRNSDYYLRGGHLSEEAYGDSDYYLRQSLPDRNNRHSGNHIPTFLKQLSDWLKTPYRITASIQQTSTRGYDLHISRITDGLPHQGDVVVGQIAVACSKGCYKILKAITQDLAGFHEEFVLVVRGVSDAVMFPLNPALDYYG